MSAEIASVPIQRVEGDRSQELTDSIAVEEPLEIRVGQLPVSITMRTPGHDLELAAGFLFSEGLIRGREDLQELSPGGTGVQGEALRNVVRVTLRSGLTIERKRLERSFYMTSSCGVCGQTSLDAVEAQRARLPRSPSPGELKVKQATILGLPDTLRRAQGSFEVTGGLHATGLFDPEGRLLELREDVGRHNAFDKVVGAALLGGRLPLSRHLVLVSGRASFELLQKAAMAGIRLVAAIGAPSSLAVELAQEQDITLIGFLRGGRFNIYHGAERILRGGQDDEATNAQRLGETPPHPG